MLIIIKFFSSFGTNEGCIEAYTRVSELIKDPLFNRLYTFTTGDDYTHAIILNTAMPVLTIPKANVIGLAFEPIEFLGLTQEFVDYAQKHIGTYLIGDKKTLPPPFTEHFAYMWHTTPLTEPIIKKKPISLMISKKNHTFGHKYRHLLCQEILNTSLPIDIYGNGCKYYINTDVRLKGEFTSKEPYLDYQFHIAIENFASPHYFSEKIMDALICESTPIYLGCQHIDTYFPGMVVQLSGNLSKDMQLLTQLCAQPISFKKQINTEQVKKTISFTNIVQKYWVYI
jgi:hypothetical protein